MYLRKWTQCYENMPINRESGLGECAFKKTVSSRVGNVFLLLTDYRETKGRNEKNATSRGIVNTSSGKTETSAGTIVEGTAAVERGTRVCNEVNRQWLTENWNGREKMSAELLALLTQPTCICKECSKQMRRIRRKMRASTGQAYRLVPALLSLMSLSRRVPHICALPRRYSILQAPAACICLYMSVQVHHITAEQGIAQRIEKGRSLF